MKKAMALLLAMLLAAGLCACGGNGKESTKAADETTQAASETQTQTEPQTETEPAKAITPAEVEAAVAAAIGEGYLAVVDVPEDAMFKSPIGALDLAKVKSYVAKQALVTAVNMDSVVVVECEDGYAEEAVQLINESFAQTVSYIRQYPFGVAKVEGARLYRVGDLVMFILAGASYDGESAEEEAKLAAAEYQKIDDALTKLFGTLPENLIVIPEATEDSHGGFNGGGILG